MFQMYVLGITPWERRQHLGHILESDQRDQAYACRFILFYDDAQKCLMCKQKIV